MLFFGIGVPRVQKIILQDILRKNTIRATLYSGNLCIGDTVIFGSIRGPLFSTIRTLDIESETKHEITYRIVGNSLHLAVTTRPLYVVKHHDNIEKLKKKYTFGQYEIAKFMQSPCSRFTD